MLDCGVSWPRALARTWSTVIPALTMGPFWIIAPESRLPVCPGWMPMPTDIRLNRPLMTLIFFFNGSSGASVLPNFIASPLPRDHQWFPLMPFPINRTAKRFGNADADCAGPPQAGNDSSHGRHIVTPTPRRTVLLAIVRVIFFSSFFVRRAYWYTDLTD